MTRPIVLIPARLAATRLPGKPLADIGGRPMIVHVWERAMHAGIGPVAVATDAAEIAVAIEAVGGIAVLTGADHASGSDRIFEALQKLDAVGNHDVVVNLQGDLPTIDLRVIQAVARVLREDPSVDIATPVARIADPAEADNPNVVKAVFEGPDTRGQGRAFTFTRLRAPWGPGPLWHHIGIYAYRRSALARFVAAAPAELERRERLEQLRALALGMHIAVQVVDTVPLGVDTPEDLARARAIHAAGARLSR